MRAPVEEPVKPKKVAVPLPEEMASHFPNYEILRILGRGGMGAVYLARQTSLNRLVAIKILPGELDDGENNFTQRFKNEAQAMAQLSHPGIVAVYDFGQTTSGLLYIVMEYIDGTDVALMVERQGRLPSAHAMAITAHVCDALAYAHGKGIIHRDIKPSNIMIGYDGVVKVADFGLAKMSQTEQSGLTQSGMVMGTLHFMAPEALTLGKAVDQRADIYAVGVMLYQMLTGKLPQGLFEMPSLQVKGLDPRYDQIVAKALREDRELRYASAGELRHDLDAILTQPVARVEASAAEAPPAINTQARPQRPAGPPAPRKAPAPVGQLPAPPKSTAGFWFGLVALVMVLGAAWFYWLRQSHTVVIHPAQGETKPGSPSRVVTRDIVLAAVAKLCPEAASKATVQQGSDGRFRVDVSGLPVTDFTPLHGLNIWNLQANNVPISDLSSVVGVGMATLWLMECPNLTDLSPLSKCTTLKDLNLSMSPVKDLSPLQSLQLVGIGISGTNVKDLTPLRDMPLVSFSFETTADSEMDAQIDLTPLGDCLTLERITVPPSSKNIESLHKLPALQQLSHRYRTNQTTTDFWAYYDRMNPWRAENAARAANVPQAATESPDHACARWAVAIGAQAWVAGATAALQSESEIPKPDFKIEKLVFWDGNKTMKEPLLTASDMWRLEGLKELRWLDLRDNLIGDSGAAKLASLTNLSTLSLNGCNITDASMQVIGKLKQLTSLDLNANQVTVNDKITDEGAAHLAQLVNLEKLYLYRSNITDKTLNGVLAALPKLKYLEVHRTQVTEAGVQAFRKARPDCYLKSDLPVTTPEPNMAPATSPKGVAPAAIPQLSEAMTLASARGGKLRAWGNFYAHGVLRSIDVSKAEGYSDFVALAGDDGRLYALRKNQVMFALDPTDRRQPVYEKPEVQRLFRDRIWPQYQNGIFIIHTESASMQTLDSSAGLLRAVASSFYRDGHVCIPYTGKAFWLPANGNQGRDRPPPVDLIHNAADAAGISYGIAVVSKDGRLRIWNFEEVIETSTEYSDIVEIRGGLNFALCRKRDGSVLVWPPASYKKGYLPDPGVQRVPTLPPAVQIRCGSDVGAAQMPDGRWIGWGADTEVVTKISSIGKALDIAIPGRHHSTVDNHGYLAWIEPLPAAQLPPELAALDTQFRALDKERVTVPYEVALAKLNNGYLASLQKAIATEKSAGKLDGISALEAEQRVLSDEAAAKAPGSQSWVAASAVPETDDDKTPASLKALRVIYREQYARLAADRTVNLNALKEPLDKRLAALESALTNTDRVSDAKAVRAYRENLAKAASGGSSSGINITKDGFTNSLGMKFVTVPGTDVMFCIHETRRQDYAAYADTVPGVNDAWRIQQRNGIPCGDMNDHPVVGVTWGDAVNFCGWLGKKESGVYRLPTDEEWSIAVGLGRMEKHGLGITMQMLENKLQPLFPWEGDYPPLSSSQAGNYADEVWREKFPGTKWIEGYSDGYATTAPVMSFKPNKQKLYDMGGNVWEWVQDWYNEMKEERGLRGGSYAMAARNLLLASDRHATGISAKDLSDIGFRLVFVPPAKP